MKKLILLSSLIFTFNTNSKEECLQNEIPVRKVNKKFVEKNDSVFTVSATIYNALPAQCDSNALETASGFKLDTINNFRFRILAVSRDLKKKFKFGTKVKVSGLIPKILNGNYIIRDVMNKRFTNKIDLLVDTSMRFSHTTWSNVKVELI